MMLAMVLAMMLDVMLAMMLAMMLTVMLAMMLDMKSTIETDTPPLTATCTLAVPLTNDPAQYEFDVVSILCTIRSKRGPKQISLHSTSGVNSSVTADACYD